MKLRLPVSTVAALSLLSVVRAQTDSSSPSPAATDKALQLDPFSVKADASNSYSTLNSNSITRFNVELDKMPLSADIFDQTFMSDVAATNVEQMLTSYSAGAGFSGNDPGSTATASTGDHTSHSNLQLRGFTVPYILRDSLMPVGSFFNPGSTGSNYTSTFDIERAEVIEGPQSLLYSSGGGGGAINVVSKQARFDQPGSGSFLYRIDQYGTKLGQLDYGVGSDNFAIRFAAVDGDQDSRRANISSSLEGYYLQAAAQLPFHSTLRVTMEQTTFNQLLPVSATLSTSTSDSRNGDALSYLLATNQASDLDNGRVNWSDLNSYGGWQDENLTVNSFVLGQFDTKWNSWFSTQLSAGYNSAYYDLSTPSVSFYSPTSTSNPTPGQWTEGMTPSDLAEPGRAKAIRFIAMADNHFFNGSVHSQTIAGGDFLRQDAAQITYDYFQADGNFNAISSPSVTTLGGRTLMPKQYFSIANGFESYPLFGPRSPAVTLNGINYVRQIENTINPALVSLSNPVGAIGSTGTYEIAKAFNQGWFAVNNTEWLDGKLDTLVGVRLANFFTQTQTSATADSARPHTRNTDFDVGVDYQVYPGFRGYVSASNTYYPPEEKGNDPVGDPTPTSSAVAEEVGLKWNSPGGKFSGSLSFYHDSGKNEQYSTSSSIENDINPAGINGRYGTSPSTFVYVDRSAEGANLILTANPTSNWRVRLSAGDVGGTVNSSTSFAQLYNDQFHANSAGQVTYADGTAVYVPAVYNSKAPTVAAGTPGAVVLTTAMMSDPTSVYYANPINPSGQINTSSAVYSVLKTIDPTHGAIATGATGLPISGIQYATPFTTPGIINVTQKGDRTVGYPELSFNVTNVYTFDTGWLKGFELGGTFSGETHYSEYYYYPLGVTNSLTRKLYSLPSGFRFDLLLGYTHKFKRVRFTSQLNVYNMTNHYSIIILPSELTGWSVANGLSARYSQDPRSYTWSNSISF